VLCDGKAIADVERASSRDCRQFDDRKSADGCRHPPRAEPLDDLQHPAIAPHEHYIDWKSHEPGVNRAAGGEDQRVTGGQRVATDQSAAPGFRVAGQLEDRCHDRARARVDER
jgi:hypothetical protein